MCSWFGYLGPGGDGAAVGVARRGPGAPHGRDAHGADGSVHGRALGGCARPRRPGRARRHCRGQLRVAADAGGMRRPRGDGQHAGGAARRARGAQRRGPHAADGGGARGPRGDGGAAALPRRARGRARPAPRPHSPEFPLSLRPEVQIAKNVSGFVS